MPSTMDPPEEPSAMPRVFCVIQERVARSHTLHKTMPAPPRHHDCPPSSARAGAPILPFRITPDPSKSYGAECPRRALASGADEKTPAGEATGLPPHGVGPMPFAGSPAESVPGDATGPSTFHARVAHPAGREAPPSLHAPLLLRSPTPIRPSQSPNWTEMAPAVKIVPGVRSLFQAGGTDPRLRSPAHSPLNPSPTPLPPEAP